MTAGELIHEMWGRCRKTAGEVGEVPAGAVEKLIQQSREILDAYGCSKRDADAVLYLVYSAIHWDGDRPTDKIFETLLEFELAEFFSERGFSA